MKNTLFKVRVYFILLSAKFGGNTSESKEDSWQMLLNVT